MLASQIALQDPENERVTQSNIAGITARGKICKVSRAMQDHMLLRDLYSSTGMHYKVLQAICDYVQQLQEGVHHTSCFLLKIFMEGITRLHHVP